MQNGKPFAALSRTGACSEEYRRQSVRSSLRSSQRLDLRRSSAQIVVEALFQVAECTGESGLFRFDLIQAQLQSGNQGSFLLVGKCQFALFKELFKIAEMFAEVNEVLVELSSAKRYVAISLISSIARIRASKSFLVTLYLL
jgi:hypothetical protein